MRALDKHDEEARQAAHRDQAVTSSGEQRSSGVGRDGDEPDGQAHAQCRKGYDTGPDKIAALVALSGTVIDPANPGGELHRGADERLRRDELPNRLASSDHQVLVVAEKYQTGFDQPLLQTHLRTEAQGDEVGLSLDTRQR